MNQTRKPPSWVSVVGVLGIIFGVLGLLGSSYGVLMPKMMAMQKEMMDSMESAVEVEREKQASNQINIKRCPDGDGAQSSTADPIEMFEAMGQYDVNLSAIGAVGRADVIRGRCGAKRNPRSGRNRSRFPF